MDKFIELLKYMFLGVVQGVTELLPISSSGHLVLFEELFSLVEPGLFFEIFTNTASLIAIIVIFYKDIIKLVKGVFLFIFKKADKDLYKADFIYVLKLFVAVVPIGLVGILLKDEIASIKNLLTVGIALFVTGSLLLVVYSTKDKFTYHDEITWRDAAFIGIAQTFAVIPGISRSGSVFIGGKASKLSLQSIIKFSMLCYILISIPASFLGIYEATQVNVSLNWLGYILAFITTLVATYLTAKFVLNKLKIEHFIYFGIYCLIVSALAITLYFV